ncbi:hypothetical protein RCL1_001930 [Eukaryota sp. TZLM3-RCL]
MSVFPPGSLPTNPEGFKLVYLEEIPDLIVHQLFRFYGTVTEFLAPHLVRIVTDVHSELLSHRPFIVLSLSTSGHRLRLHRRYMFFCLRVFYSRPNSAVGVVYGCIYRFHNASDVPRGDLVKFMRMQYGIRQLLAFNY